jgi:hypothetical protein
LFVCHFGSKGKDDEVSTSKPVKHSFNPMPQPQQRQLRAKRSPPEGLEHLTPHLPQQSPTGASKETISATCVAPLSLPPARNTSTTKTSSISMCGLSLQHHPHLHMTSYGGNAGHEADDLDGNIQLPNQGGFVSA